MNFFLDMARDSVVAMVEQAPEYHLASDWLKTKDRDKWARIVDRAVADLIVSRGIPAVNAAMWQARQEIWEAAQSLWFTEVTPEQHQNTMDLFGTAVIEEFKTPYGEEFDCFTFDAAWEKFHGADGSIDCEGGDAG